jgi:3-oxoacyl-[acyl-carrier-protein] synthase-3
MGIRIISTGSYLPRTIDAVASQTSSKESYNADLAWLFSGAQEHRVCTEQETSTHMGIQAAKNALTKGDIDPATIDTVLSYTGVADHETPKDVYGIINGAGCDGAMAWTIDTACASFLSHLHCANALSSMGRRRFLIIDSMNWVNRAFDDDTKRNGPGSLVGDGAGAVIAETVSGRGNIIDVLEITSTEDFNFIKMNSAQVSGDREYLAFTKSPKIIYRAFSILPETAKRLLDKNGLSPSDISWTITHQPGINAILKWHEMVGIPVERNLNTFKLYGNMSAANIPVTLDHFISHDQKINRGDLILAFTAGAGIHCAAALIQY